MAYSEYIIGRSTLNSIANAVRSLTHTSEAFTPAQMMSEIQNYEPSVLPVLAHYSDQTITSVYSDCDIVGNYAYRYCSNITKIDLPKCQVIGLGAFEHCANLEYISIPECRQIDAYAFAAARSYLSSIDLPKCTYIGSGVFTMAEGLISISIPNVEYIGSNAFYLAMSNGSVTLLAPKCRSILSCFYACQGLVVASLPVCTYIWGFAFFGCNNLTDIYLDKVSKVTTLSNASRCFSGCTNLISIHVPASLYSDFIADKSWSTYASMIVSA